jgi:hypothetical protein
MLQYCFNFLCRNPYSLFRKRSKYCLPLCIHDVLSFYCRSANYSWSQWQLEKRLEGYECFVTYCLSLRYKVLYKVLFLFVCCCCV